LFNKGLHRAIQRHLQSDFPARHSVEGALARAPVMMFLLELQLHAHLAIVCLRGAAVSGDEQALGGNASVREDGGMHCLRALTARPA
jgi:hypothetical protein